MPAWSAIFDDDPQLGELLDLALGVGDTEAAAAAAGQMRRMAAAAAVIGLPGRPRAKGK